MEKIKLYGAKLFSDFRVSLFLALFLASAFLVWFSFLGILPLKSNGDFIFSVVLVLLFSLYRPAWAFLALVTVIAMENVILSPENFFFSVRPYQLLAGSLIISLVVKYFKDGFQQLKEKLSWLDICPILMILGVGLSAFFNPSFFDNFKTIIIFSSFVGLYFLARLFVQNFDDLKKVTPFFLGGTFLVLILSFFQNIFFLHGRWSGEVMPGRPNGTLFEPDWLGMFLILPIIAIVSFLNKEIREQNKNYYKIFVEGLFLVGLLGVLVITVSRSAWLGAGAGMITFAFGSIFWMIKSGFKNNIKKSGALGVGLLLAFFLALAIVVGLPLTNFQLINRFQSTSSGIQKITVACKSSENLPTQINNVSELEALNCQHINLEEIETKKNQGYVVEEIYRQDPNVNIRKTIWNKSLTMIKNQPIWGIGWGNIGNRLGQDENGATLNASNIFLEMWLGAGLLGVMSLVVFLVGIVSYNLRCLIKCQKTEIYFSVLFILSSLVGLLISNMFNSGLLLGFLWIFFAITLTSKNYENRH